MAVLRLSTHSVSRKRVLGAALIGAALVVAAVGVRARLDTSRPAPAVAAPAPALAPLYVLPEQPAALIAAIFVAPPERQYEDWEVNLIHAPHGR